MLNARFDAVVWIRDNLTDTSAHKSDATTGDGLKIAGSTPGQGKDDGIGVLMSMDKDEVTRRQERAAEAEAKRQQNIMPSWHLKSTISGDLTALGIAENARIVDGPSVNGSSSNEDILRSLGSARVQPQQPKPQIEVQEEVKPVIDQSQQEQECMCFFTDRFNLGLAVNSSCEVQSMTNTTPL
jgi:transcription initiation factor TFIIE subunit alpha